jgi:alkylation response protein AidB-like acyl-CoA dehydrogenase
VRPLFDDDHEAYRESFQTFLSREGDGDDVFAKAVENGFASMAVPEDRGGAGIDDRRFGVVVTEELALCGRAALGLVFAAHDEAVRRLDVGADRLAAVALGSLEGVAGGMWADDVLFWDGSRLVHFAADAAARTASDEGIGMQGAGFADFSLDGVDLEDVPDDGLVTDLQIGLAVLALAGARHALGLTLEYVADRKAFGVPIASFQNTRYALAAVSAEIETAQAFLDDVVARDRNPARAAAAKLCATEIQARAVDAGLQFHGGYGYMTEYPISLAYADARFLRLYGGTSESLKDTLASALGM